MSYQVRPKQGGYQPQQGGYQPQQQQGGYQVRQKQPQQGGGYQPQQQQGGYQVRPKPQQYQNQNQYEIDSDDLNVMLDEIDRDAEQSQGDQMIIGDALSAVRDEMNQKFVNIAQTMEQQLATLKRQIAKQKQVNNQLKQKIAQSDKQRDEFKQEAQNKTNDLSSLNGLYSNNAPQDQYQNLLNAIVQRHQQFQQALQQTAYPQNVGAMNKAWQDEIYKISQLIANSPDKAEFATLVDEMKNRTRELNTLRQIESGQIPYSVIADIVDQCEERHAAMVGDQMSSYKSPGVITDQNVIQNNKQWENLLGMVRDYIFQNQEKLKQRNDLYMNELKGRVNDLSQFKFILNAPADIKPGGKKLKKKEIQSLKYAQQMQKTKDLQLKIQTRHSQNENQVRNTMNLNNQKDQQEMNRLQQNDGSYRTEFNQDTDAIVDFMIN